MRRDFKKEAQGLIEGKTLFDVPMRRFTSMRVGGPADCLLFPKDVEELKRVILHANTRGIPLFILGKGTNLIVKDQGIRGWVVSLTRGLKKIRMKGETIEAEAGATLLSLIRYSIQRGLSGLEAFGSIPGTVGGALAMNAGAWGIEMKDVTHSITFLDGENGDVKEQPKRDLSFSYRKLAFPSSWVILEGWFQVWQGRKEEILGRLKSYSERRRDTQPTDFPSAGSIFKNPKEGPAGRWIEEAGLKGFRIGQAMVSPRHANFIINLGKASATEVLDLIEEVARKVYEAKGIFLEPEVQVIGG